jgi:hypothetical protein
MARRGHAGGQRDLLGEALLPLEPRRCCARAGADYSRVGERIGEPRHERRLRAGHDEIDFIGARKGDQRRKIERAGGHSLRNRGDAGIARRAPELGEQRARGERPAQRVLARARSHHQNPHAPPPRPALA